MFLFVTGLGFISPAFAASHNDKQTAEITSINFGFSQHFTKFRMSPYSAKDLNRVASSIYVGSSLKVMRGEVLASTSVPAGGGQAGVTATCPPGWVLTGGGSAGLSATGVFVTKSKPTGFPYKWMIRSCYKHFTK